MSDPMTAAVPDPTVEALSDKLADWLGEMPESRNVFDHTDEATTLILIDVETLARRVAVEIHNSVAAARAAAPDALRVRIEALATKWEGWRATRSTPRIDAFGDAARELRALLED